MLILLSDFEYMLLCIIRRFLLTNSFLLRFGRHIPYYEVNQGQVSPVPIVDSYFKYCSKIGITLSNQPILEVGTGTANGTGYEIIGRMGGGITGVTNLL